MQQMTQQIMTSGQWQQLFLSVTSAVLLLHSSSTSAAGWSNTSCPQDCLCSLKVVADNDNNAASPQQPLQQQRQLEQLKTAVCNFDEHDDERLSAVVRQLPDDLTSLSLQRCSLRSISDLCCLGSLRSLDLSFNKLDSLLSYDSMTTLQQLDVSHNRLQTLTREEFIGFPKLEHLNLAHNLIESLHPESLRLLNLKQLFLNGNRLQNVPERSVRYLSQLESLNLAGNRLDTVRNRNFYYLRRLKTLDLSGNQLQTVPVEVFEPLRNIEELNLGYNSIGEVPLLALLRQRRLRTLDLSGNRIQYLRSFSFQNLTLEELRLNDINTLELIFEDAFSRMPRLTVVHLTQNLNLTYISMDAFSRVPNIRQLHLDRSDLQLLPAEILSLPSVRRISLTGAASLDCDCFRRELSRSGLSLDQLRAKLVPSDLVCYSSNGSPQLLLSGPDIRDSSSSANACRPRVFPVNDETLKAYVGEGLTLFCAVSPPLSSWAELNVSWTVRNADGSGSRSLASALNSEQYRLSAEALQLLYVRFQDSATYRCAVTNKSNSNKELAARSVTVKVLTPVTVITPQMIGANYITVHWNHSSEYWDQGVYNFSVQYKELGAETFHHISHTQLSYFRQSYTITRLTPDTNYTLCLTYSRHNFILHRNCTTVLTRDASYLNAAGISLNYGLISVVAVLGSFVFAMCFVRCVYARYYIWQQAKAKSRIQGSLSGQGFFAASFDSLSRDTNTTAGHVTVTYENTAAAAAVTPMGDEDEERMLADTVTVNIKLANGSTATTRKREPPDNNNCSSNRFAVDFC